jgi:hypothetical protein
MIACGVVCVCEVVVLVGIESVNDVVICGLASRC